MIEKLFILQENNKYHMKVEAQAEPMSAIIERKLQSADNSSMMDDRTKTKKIN